MSLLYNFTKLPRWGDNATNADFATSDTGRLNNDVAPYSQDFATGYDAKVGRLNPTREAHALTKSNANICDGSYYFPLFINAISIDFSLAGSLAQSALTRDMYPHNINIPSFVLQGQSYDQHSYGQMIEFIHLNHRRAITSDQTLLQLYIRGNVHPNVQGTRHAHKPQGVTLNGTMSENQIIKGQHETILAQGYIASMPRQHQTGVYMPTYSMQFVVARMIKGPYQDNLDHNVKQSTWVSLLTGTDAVELGTKSQLKQNIQFLNYAEHHAGNAISSSATS